MYARGRVGHVPRVRPGVFVPFGQSLDGVAQPGGILVYPGRRVQVHRAVVPRRHDAAVFVFGGIPGRADVGVGSRTDQQCRTVRGEAVANADWPSPCARSRCRRPQDGKHCRGGESVVADRHELAAETRPPSPGSAPRRRRCCTAGHTSPQAMPGGAGCRAQIRRALQIGRKMSRSRDVGSAMSGGACHRSRKGIVDDGPL